MIRPEVIQAINDYLADPSNEMTKRLASGTIAVEQLAYAKTDLDAKYFKRELLKNFDTEKQEIVKTLFIN